MQDRRLRVNHCLVGAFWGLDGKMYIPFMKRIVPKSLPFLLLIFFGSTLFGQNSIPAISNLATNHAMGNGRIDFTFDVSDAESDPLEISIRISADSGRTWRVALDSIVGDTGFPVTPGPGKTISWYYDLNDLAVAYGSGPLDFRARIIADDRQPMDIQAILNQVDSTRLVSTLRTIEGVRHRTTNPAHLQFVQDTIHNVMAAHGLQDWDHDVVFGGYTGKNIIGRIAGTTAETETWMLSGHYDSVSNAPGADDNGTAVSAVMEAVRILSNYNFKNSVRFAGFDLEEEFLNGSFEYAFNRIEPWEDFKGLLNMEMLGYKDTTANSQSVPPGFNLLFPAAYAAVQADGFRGNFLTNVANEDSDGLRAIFDSCAALYVPDLRVISLATPGTGLLTLDLRRSDHAPFWDAGYEALMLTDAANLRNPFYHTAADTIGTLDLHFYVQSVKAVVATALKVAQVQHADVAASGGVTVNLPVGQAQPALPALEIFPNPSDGKVTVRWTVDVVTQARLLIRDLNGKTIAQLHDGIVRTGTQRFEWLGTDGSGRPAANGTYLVVLETRGRRIVKKVLLQR